MRYVNIFRYNPGPGPGHTPDSLVLKWLLIKWLCLTGAVLFTAFLLEGIRVSGPFSAIFTAAALGVLNLFFRPVLFILTLPINIMTLGLFTFIINAVMLKMASMLVPGFTVTGFWTAVFGSLLISIANWVLYALIREQGVYENPDTIELEKKDDKWE